MAYQMKMPSSICLLATNNTAGMSWTADSGGDAVILYVVLCMWVVKMTVVNRQMLQQYKVRHMVGLKDADIALMFNALSHHTAVGMCETHF